MVTATDLAAPLVGATSSMMTWEEVPCPMCRHDHWHPVIEGADNYPGSTGLRFAIVRCDRCGLKFTNPRPTFESMDRFYPIGYEPHRRASLTRKPRRRWYPFRVLPADPVPNADRYRGWAKADSSISAAEAGNIFVGCVNKVGT